MLSKTRLQRTIAYMVVAAICAAVSDSPILFGVFLTSIFILVALLSSLEHQEPRNMPDHLEDMFRISFPLTKYTNEFVKDDKFISAFVYIYRMSPEKLLAFMRMQITLRDSTDQEILKLASQILRTEIKRNAK